MRPPDEKVSVKSGEVSGNCNPSKEVPVPSCKEVPSKDNSSNIEEDKVTNGCAGHANGDTKDMRGSDDSSVLSVSSVEDVKVNGDCRTSSDSASVANDTASVEGSPPTVRLKENSKTNDDSGNRTSRKLTLREWSNNRKSDDILCSHSKGTYTKAHRDILLQKGHPGDAKECASLAKMPNGVSKVDTTAASAVPRLESDYSPIWKYSSKVARVHNHSLGRKEVPLYETVFPTDEADVNKSEGGEGDVTEDNPPPPLPPRTKSLKSATNGSHRPLERCMALPLTSHKKVIENRVLDRRRKDSTEQEVVWKRNDNKRVGGQQSKGEAGGDIVCRTASGGAESIQSEPSVRPKQLKEKHSSVSRGESLPHTKGAGKEEPSPMEVSGSVSSLGSSVADNRLESDDGLSASSEDALPSAYHPYRSSVCRCVPTDEHTSGPFCCCHCTTVKVTPCLAIAEGCHKGKCISESTPSRCSKCSLVLPPSSSTSQRSSLVSNANSDDTNSSHRTHWDNAPPSSRRTSKNSSSSRPQSDSGCAGDVDIGDAPPHIRTGSESTTCMIASLASSTSSSVFESPTLDCENLEDFILPSQVCGVLLSGEGPLLPATHLSLPPPEEVTDTTDSQPREEGLGVPMPPKRTSSCNLQLGGEEAGDGGVKGERLTS